MSGGATDTANLFFESGGEGSPTLLLLHGLGGNSAVWRRLLPFVQSRWPGRWIAPDLRGNGRSFHRAPYDFGIHAADVANLLGQNETVVCLGHSMGGVIAMALASGWFGVQVRQVVAFGVKVEWRPEENARLRDIARSPIRWFDTRPEALQRFLRVSGLEGLIGADSDCAAHGISECNGKFRLAMDPRANLGGAPLAAMIRAMNAPLRFVAGANDPMVTAEQMRCYDPDAVLIEDAGHNAHVQAPERLWQLAGPILLKYTTA